MKQNNLLKKTWINVPVALFLLGCNEPVQKPNVLFIAVDDLRPNMGCYGDTNLENHFREAIPDVLTLSQAFSSNGYEAMGIGTIYHGGKKLRMKFPGQNLLF